MQHQYKNSFSWKARWGMFVIVFVITLFQQIFAQPLVTGRTKFLGCATSSAIWLGPDSCWNQITPNNDGKWGSLTFMRGVYDWRSLDTIYNYAIQQGLQYKHHNLVWGNQQPNWISTLDSADQRMEVEKWIRLVGQRYPKMTFVDVVNEPLLNLKYHNAPPYKNALGGDGATGWDWVITAFTWARQYCSIGVKLLLNEFNVLHDANATNRYIQLIDTLKNRGLIDGIGVQGHYFELRSQVSTGGYVYDIDTLKANLDRLTATGLPIYISEFDIEEPDEATQLAQYQIYFPLFWNHPGVKGITLWGYIQNDVWDQHPNTYIFNADGTARLAAKWLREYVSNSNYRSH
ncbi:MAG: endo-1,4-beta-xylanase [Bacteroidota bacterium]